MPLISITDLALIHNYNTIKCICFISQQQRAGMSSRYYYNKTSQSSIHTQTHTRLAQKEQPKLTNSEAKGPSRE